MKFHETQSKVVRDKTRFRVVNCGRQWGKTTLSVWEMFGCAYAKQERIVTYFATTFDQARDIAWNELKKITKPVWAGEPNETRLELHIKTQDGGFSKIRLRGWQSIEAERGKQNDFIVCDEVSKMRNFQEGWEGVLMATLAFRQGSALFISTPYGFNHFHKLYEMEKSDGLNWKSFRFSSLDNPHLPVDYLNTVKQTVTPDFWAQEYLADFRRFTGLVYPEFDLNRHVHDFDHVFNSHGEYLFGQDFAVRGYTALVNSVQKEDQDIYVLDNYKEEGRSAEVHITSEKELLTKYADLDKYTGLADPAGFAKNQQKGDMLWSLADEYVDAGMPITRANNEVTPGINYLKQLFANDKIHIHPRCTKLIEELMQYQWKEKPGSQEGYVDDPEKVRKINDHLVDALRYLCYSKPLTGKEEEIPRGLPIEFKLKIDEEKQEDKFDIIDFPSLYEYD